MKKLQVFVLSLFFAMIANFSLAANPSAINPEEIRKEIKQYVADIDLTTLDIETERVTVQFLINSKNEIIIIEVDNDSFDQIIKNRLNYKILKTKAVEYNKVFTVPLLFEKK